MTEALHFLTIAEAARRLEAKTLSPVALVEALFDRIGSLDPQLDAFVSTFSNARPCENSSTYDARSVP